MHINDNDTDKFSESIGKVLNRLRVNSNYSRAFVAEKVGRTVSWLSMMETGKSATTVNSLISLLELYGHSLSSFFELVEEEYRDTSILKGNLAVIRKVEWQRFESMEGMIYLLPPPKGKLKDGRMDITPVILKSGHRSGIVLHSGEEVLYILEGRIRFRFYKDSERKYVIKDEDLCDEGRDYIELNQDDAIHFFSAIRHEAENADEQDAKYLVIRCPKRFP